MKACVHLELAESKKSKRNKVRHAQASTKETNRRRKRQGEGIISLRIKRARTGAFQLIENRKGMGRSLRRTAKLQGGANNAQRKCREETTDAVFGSSAGCDRVKKVGDGQRSAWVMASRKKKSAGKWKRSPEGERREWSAAHGRRPCGWS